MIDFTNCKKLNKTYGGANGNKICILYNNEKYMLKFPSTPTKNTELSYSNGCISEYISCNIYNMFGIKAQSTLLGTYKVKQKEKIVVACKDFTDIGIVLQDFGSLKNQIIDSEHNGYGTELNDILDAIERQTQVEPIKVIERFWDMFVVDALLGNFDRHNGNWGFLYNQITDTVELAPVYDCGSCLLPQADKQTIQKILNSDAELNARIYNYPTSAIKMHDKKINYHAFLTTTNDVNCLNALIRIETCFDKNKIIDLIDSIEYIDDIQKKFYKQYIFDRNEKILVPSYIRAKQVLFEEQVKDNDNEIEI